MMGYATTKPRTRRIYNEPDLYDNIYMAEDGHWYWTGVLSNTGYGRYKRKQAHRVVYEREVGPIPEGLVLDHLCRIRCCVRPYHLEPVTPEENTRRGMLPILLRKQRTPRALTHMTRRAIIKAEAKRIAMQRYEAERAERLAAEAEHRAWVDREVTQRRAEVEAMLAKRSA